MALHRPPTDWEIRGRACRMRRSRARPYLTQWVIAARAGLSLFQLSSMERGAIDPTPLETWWKEHAAAQVVAELPPPA